MHDIAESTKVDCAIYPIDGSTSYNGEYFNMKKYAKALFVVQVSGQLTGEEIVFKVYECVDAAGGGTPAQLGADITLAQGIKITIANLAPAATTSVNDTLIITPYTFVNGVMTAGTALTFTAKAGETLASRYWDQASGGTAEAISIAACINHATYGVPGMLATVHDTDEVTLTMTEPGDGVFTITESAAAKLVVTDLLQQAHFEVAVRDMDRDNDFTHIQARVSDISASVEFYSCTLIRAVAGYQPVGQVSAYTDDAS